jgi:hypothetical protein
VIVYVEESIIDTVLEFTLQTAILLLIEMGSNATPTGLLKP